MTPDLIPPPAWDGPIQTTKFSAPETTYDAVNANGSNSVIVNLLFGLGYWLGILLLVFPPVGIMVIIIVYQRHKAYRTGVPVS